ncbi:Iron-sulfur cluster assembly protein CyaY [Burkholderiales bacterium 8X]|nr:Iron-sulfur cluster assembly protein CyaY [Burkholderiales bacterium 8X]
MTDSEYLDRAEAALAAIESGCDRINEETEADIDNQRTGGMITISFQNGSQLIVNLQKPLQEIWLAAQSGGYHYRHDGTAWRDTKTGDELFAVLAREASRQSGMPLAFAPEAASS